MTLVRTLLGDIPEGELGVCDAHDHLFFRSAQWTPFGLGGRRPRHALPAAGAAPEADRGRRVVLV